MNFTYDLWTTLLVMLVGGLIGGIVNRFLAPGPDEPPKTLAQSVILGIGASVLVPVFLFVTQSKILDKLFNPVGPNLTAADKAINLLVFIGLCVLAAISSSRFIASVSDRVITQLKEEVRETKEKAKEAKEESREARKEARAVKQTNAATQESVRENKETIRALKQVQKSRSLAQERRSIRPQTDRGSVLESLAAPSDDPQKGRWGGQPVRDGYRLSATVKAVDSDNDFFRVLLQLTAPDSAQLPPDTSVTFHLHDTFVPPDRPVLMQDGHATLELYAWGAFTVGAEAPGGIQLELDLADPSLVPDAPQPFRDR